MEESHESSLRSRISPWKGNSEIKGLKGAEKESSLASIFGKISSQGKGWNAAAYKVKKRNKSHESHVVVI